MLEDFRANVLKQIKSTGNVPQSKPNLLTTEYANPDSRKLAGRRCRVVENGKILKFLHFFCSFFRNLLRISKENHLSKKTQGTPTIQAS